MPVRREKKPAATDLAPGSALPAATQDTPDAQNTMSPVAAIDLTVPADYARNRAAALSEQLTHSASTAHDDALREEIADIAATMVALTAAKEGKGSPIPALLSTASTKSDATDKSLAIRARDMLPPEQH
jgi:hypothetical protein